MNPGMVLTDIYSYSLQHIYRRACLIDEEGKSFLLVGGHYTKSKVSRYTEDRWVQDLDNLNVGRVLPACGWFVDSSGIRVRNNIKKQWLLKAIL